MRGSFNPLSRITSLSNATDIRSSVDNVPGALCLSFR
jgi:hypothetical protein